MAVVPLLFGMCVVVAVFGLSGSAPLSKATDAVDVVPKQLKDGQVYLSYLDTDGKSGQRNLIRPDLFLIQFGYASKWNESVVRERVKSGLPIGLEGKELTDALRAYQRQNDLPLTGKVDVHTQRSMLESRCGVSDVRRGRFTVFPDRWEHQNLSYNFVKYSERLPKSMIEVVFKQAFGYWEQVTALRFVRKPDDEIANIRIAFHTGYHGDGAHNSFDGPDGIFGHAFYPSDGHIHLDDQELFTEGTHKGMNLRIIAAHEIGHVLGLDHSWTKGSLMYPRYQGYVPHRKFRLASDDIAGIRHMYGPQKPIEVPDGLKYLDNSYLAAMMMADEPVADPQMKTKYPAVRTTTATTTAKITAPTSVTTTTTTPFMTTTTHKPPVTVKAWPKPTARVGEPDPCESRIDAAFVWHDAAKYFLRGSLLYRQGPGESSMMSVAFPRDIRRYLIDAPLKTNAAVYSPYSSNLYLFHGRKMYVYDRLGFLQTTKKMTEPDFPDNIDSAFINRDGTVCFVKDDILYEYDEWRHVIEKIVPLSSVYVGLPSTIDAVINDSPWVLDYEYIYFFKGPKYYKVNIKSLTVDRDYPRDIGGPWFGCKTWTVPK